MFLLFLAGNREYSRHNRRKYWGFDAPNIYKYFVIMKKLNLLISLLTAYFPLNLDKDSEDMGFDPKV